MEYEHEKLQEKIANGKLTLDLTKVIQQASACALLPILHFFSQAWINKFVASHSSKGHAATHLAAMVTLVIKSEKIDPASIPETLKFDGYRIRAIQKQFSNLVNGAVLLVLAHETIPTSKATLARLIELTSSNMNLEKILTTLRDEYPDETGLILTAMTLSVNVAKDRIHNLM